jgi:hypothetical protein
VDPFHAQDTETVTLVYIASLAPQDAGNGEGLASYGRYEMNLEEAHAQY